jgi:hypothetical protein
VKEVREGAFQHGKAPRLNPLETNTPSRGSVPIAKQMETANPFIDHVIFCSPKLRGTRIPIAEKNPLRQRRDEFAGVPFVAAIRTANGGVTSANTVLESKLPRRVSGKLPEIISTPDR